MEFLPSVEIEPCIIEFKYMFNPVSLSIIGYIVRFLRKAKTPLERGDGKDREVSPPELPTKYVKKGARAVTIPNLVV
jgi:hypothetical protein